MITTHVTSLEYSIRLKEAGILQESEFYWVKLDDEHYELLHINDVGMITHRNAPRWSAYLASELIAYIDDELLRLMPPGYLIDNKRDLTNALAEAYLTVAE